MTADLNLPRSGLIARNFGEPIKLTDVNIHGVSANAAQKGEMVSVLTRLEITSDERFFHRIADNLCATVQNCAHKDGKTIELKHASVVLLILKPDNSADLWIDTVATSLTVMMKRPIVSGAPVFEHDIADVTGMSFPLVEISDADRVVCLFRQDWRFGLFFDFNPDGLFDKSAMERSLGRLYRSMRYRHLYEAMFDQGLFEKLISFGWFPFAEVISSEFKDLVLHCEANFSMSEVEQSTVEKFDLDRLERMFARWMSKPHFESRETILRSAINSFAQGNYIAAIKTTLTEIEGILAEAYKAVHGKKAKLPKLLRFATESAERKSGGADTLLFTAAFAQYLASNMFAEFNPMGPLGKAGSRHAVGHGAAEPSSYTSVRALQALLTLDQISFYT